MIVLRRKSSMLWYDFCGPKDLNKKKNIHKKTLFVYGQKCLSPKSVNNWVKKVSQGRSKIVDEDQSGRRVLISTKSIEQQVEELVRADRRVIIESISTAI
ncbi:hypothetical protein TNCV_3603261 [Trichonephila clavipes]|nr:hypothetical protein TNCV_3603261 [Trichonephila clavipes]